MVSFTRNYLRWLHQGTWIIIDGYLNLSFYIPRRNVLGGVWYSNDFRWHYRGALMYAFGLKLFISGTLRYFQKHNGRTKVS